MAQTMTASVMTDGQIDGFVDKLRAALRKHREEISSEVAQQVQGLPNLGMELFSVIRHRVEARSNLIVRKVEKIDRSREPQAVLDATKRKQYTDRKVVDIMSHGEGEGAEVVFFKPRPEAYVNGVISDDRLEEEYAWFGLVPCDPYSLAAVNEADPDFADEKPNGTHWRDKNGKWCYEAFFRWDGERDVNVSRNENDWFDHWWFAGLRK